MSTTISTDTPVQSIASEAYDQFEIRTRIDGTEYICVKDNAPEWITDLCREAHGDMYPDDHRYDFIRSALGIIAEEEDEDLYSDRIDSQTDVYNSHLSAWLASSLDRAAYVDDAVREYGWDDKRGIWGALAMGQYSERYEVLYLVLSYLNRRLAES